ncbi:MAG: hypothetical protein JWL64_783, partial [Frankiales bacterium]|nr:hypothetical protein [Frankiales bacterium]
MTTSVDVPEGLADPAVALARRWLAATQSGGGGGSAAERRATR